VAFGAKYVDYAMLVKVHRQTKGGSQDSAERRHSPPECIGCPKTPMLGNPDLAAVSTSYIERQNLTMRM
jgi:hypothetical protein